MCNDHHFKDDYLFYRFGNDEATVKSIKEKLGLVKSSKKDVSKCANSTGDNCEVYEEIGTATSNKEDE